MSLHSELHTTSSSSKVGKSAVVQTRYYWDQIPKQTEIHHMLSLHVLRLILPLESTKSQPNGVESQRQHSVNHDHILSIYVSTHLLDFRLICYKECHLYPIKII